MKLEETEGGSRELLVGTARGSRKRERRLALSTRRPKENRGNCSRELPEVRETGSDAGLAARGVRKRIARTARDLRKRERRLALGSRRTKEDRELLEGTTRGLRKRKRRRTLSSRRPGEGCRDRLRAQLGDRENGRGAALEARGGRKRIARTARADCSKIAKTEETLDFKLAQTETGLRDVLGGTA